MYKCFRCKTNDAKWTDRRGNQLCISCAETLNGCEICGSTSELSRDGEQLHFEEDCFK